MSHVHSALLLDNSDERGSPGSTQLIKSLARRSGALAARARSIYAEIGRTIELSGNGGASESALAMAEGTPALDGLGFVGEDFHTDHEWIDLDSAVPRLYLFRRLLLESSDAARRAADQPDPRGLGARERPSAAPPLVAP